MEEDVQRLLARVRAEQAQIRTGMDLYAEGRFEEALRSFSRASELSGDTLGLHTMFAVQCLYRLGRLEEAAALAEAAMSYAFEHARAANPADPVLLPAPAHNMVLAVGEMSTRFDLLLKAQALSILPPFRPLVVIDADARPANRALLDLFGAKLPLTILPKAEARDLRRRFRDQMLYLDFLPLPGQGWMQLIPAWSHVNRLWQEQQRPPLWQLDEGLSARGEAMLRRWGVPEGAWFVCLHVREGGYYGEAATHPAALRNGDVATMLPALAEITARGGWVVRLGDPSMSPLPSLPQVIDYAHRADRCDWMDLYLAATCRFIIGMASGISQLPPLFGRPLLLVNGFALGPLPVAPGSLYLHKLIRRVAEDRLLPFACSFSPPLVHQYHPLYFRRHGLEVRDNTEDEIRHGVREMMASLEGTLTYDSEDDARWARYARAADPHRFGLVGRVSKYFLAKHEGLL